MAIWARASGLALMVPLSVAMMLWLMPASQAADNWQVEGSNGVLHISGALAESACRLKWLQPGRMCGWGGSDRKA